MSVQIGVLKFRFSFNMNSLIQAIPYTSPAYIAGGSLQEFFATQAATQAAGLFTSKSAEIPEVRGWVGVGI